MHKLRSLVLEIMEIYQESHDSFQSFQQQTGLTCPPDCGGCCLSTEIGASILEMLPSAMNLYDLNLAEKTLHTLEQLDEIYQCIFYVKLSENGRTGRCSNYKFRPCICRSFGAATIRDKTGKKIISVCKEIKIQKLIDLNQINLGGAPIIGEFSSRILCMEFSQNTQVKPINQALKEALRHVLNTSAYTELTN